MSFRRFKMSKDKKIIFSKYFIFVCIWLFLLSYPATATVSVLNGLTHERNLLPGEKASGSILIKNVGSKPEIINLYQSDYWFDAQGRKYFEKPGSLVRSNAFWIKLKEHEIELLPQEIREINYEINVPADSSLRGTYWSLIMIECLPEKMQIQKETLAAMTSLNLKVKVRYGLQIITNIGQGGERKVRFFNPHFFNEANKLFFSIDVENTGEIVLNPDLHVSIIDSNGQEIGQFLGERRRLFPQTSARFQVEIASPIQDKNKLLVILDNRDDLVFAAEYSLNLGQKKFEVIR